MTDLAYPAAQDQCPVELSARIIGQKWTLQIVNHLIHDGALRFCELQEALGGVNPSTLSSRLKMLEEEGIVQRTQRSTVPPHVEYSLTPKGASLDRVIMAVRTWGNRWLCDPGADSNANESAAVMPAESLAVAVGSD